MLSGEGVSGATGVNSTMTSDLPSKAGSLQHDSDGSEPEDAIVVCRWALSITAKAQG